jgi:hypothetical protein
MKHKEWVMGAALASLWACGSPEQATVEQFFRAARTDDSATVAAMSAVAPPEAVESWEVVEISSQSTEPVALPGLLAELKAAEEERDANLEQGREYMAEHQEDVDTITAKLQEDPAYVYSGDMGEVQAAWNELLEGRRSTERAYQEIKREVDDETKLATKSVVRQANLAELNGSVAVTEMLLMLKLEGAEPKPYTVQLRKYDLSGGDGPAETSRWVIVDIQEKEPT